MFFYSYIDYIEKYCGDISEWYLFEKQVEELTGSFYQISISEYLDENIIKQFNEVFLRVQHELIEYLYIATSKGTGKDFQSIRDFIHDNTLCINFNYTATVEKYLNRADIIYVHGSLVEQDIVLGHDPKTPYCLASYENMIWFKEYCRERLSFCRYIKKQYNISTSDLVYQELLNDFLQVRIILEHKGCIDNIDRKKLIHPDLIDEYMSRFGRMDIIINQQAFLENIKTIIVIGHSLESDREYLKELLDKCISLQEVVIFSYDGETKWEEKANFFTPYCKQIRKVMYE